VKQSLALLFLFASFSSFSGRSFAIPNESATCNADLHAQNSEAVPATVSKKLELTLHEKSNGAIFMHLLPEDGSFKSHAFNRVIEALHTPLNLHPFAEGLDRFAKDTRTQVPYFTRFLDAMQVKPHFDETILTTVPKTGPVILYANHPLSGMDVFTISAVLDEVRPDVKVIATEFLGALPEFSEHSFLLDTTHSSTAKIKNKVVLQAINQYLADGHAILVFPAGRVSSLTPELPHFAVDPEWQKGIVQMAKRSPEATLVPIFVEGQPSSLFLKAKKMMKKYADYLLVSEISKLVGTDITLDIARPFAWQDLDALTEEQKLLYLRARVYEMGTAYYETQTKTTVPAGTNPLVSNAEKEVLNLFGPHLF
jgi:hypothetical protein